MNPMQGVQQQQQQQQQRNDYGHVLGQIKGALEAIRVMPRGGREAAAWLPPESISAKALKEFKNKVLSSAQTTSRRVDAAILAISILSDGVRAEQEFRFKYAYLKTLRTDLDNHQGEVLESRKKERAAKRARREIDAQRPNEVQLQAGDVGELSAEEEDLR